MALTNAKGGVGRTTVTTHLATALARTGLTIEVWNADPFHDTTAYLDPDVLPHGLALAGKTAPYALPGHRFAPRLMPTANRSTDVVLIDTRCRRA
ncbi:AAA family ATPase [Micrococcus luteus]|uniref:nucleotide-binding protein n=1 Tax=Micrococcus luteus TaxID=1270 RepID=UPI003D3389BC